MGANAENYISKTKYLFNTTFISSSSQKPSLVLQRMLVQKIKPYCSWTSNLLVIENKVLAVSEKGLNLEYSRLTFNKRILQEYQTTETAS